MTLRSVQATPWSDNHKLLPSVNYGLGVIQRLDRSRSAVTLITQMPFFSHSEGFPQLRFKSLTYIFVTSLTSLSLKQKDAFLENWLGIFRQRTLTKQ